MTSRSRAGERVTLEHVGMFADGVAVRRVGDETFRLAREVRRRDRARRHRRDLRGDQGHLRGHALDRRAGGRARRRGLKRWRRAEPGRGKTLIAINSGANMNFDRLRHVAERAEIGEQREALIAVEIPERPGELPRVLRDARSPQRHRVQLPLRGRARRRRSSSACRSRAARTRRASCSRRCARPATRCST